MTKNNNSEVHIEKTYARKLIPGISNSVLLCLLCLFLSEREPGLVT